MMGNLPRVEPDGIGRVAPAPRALSSDQPHREGRGLGIPRNRLPSRQYQHIVSDPEPHFEAAPVEVHGQFRLTS
ncbi:hypothetical protein MB901379_00588 [Mycobacterium basiliense]|uniref:Uncharacterized protein n=1 Tax=Mycobacterium basiliense TaxID=2094119 RepID=A0A3S4BC02_9MYCO|nr:hypothetical protein MB901379_00588 [Mycobacterium basiliense]